MIKDIEIHYKKFFNDEDDIEGINGIQQFDEGIPRQLQKPITVEEIESIVSKLGNNKANGPDGINAEYFKYGGIEIKKYIAWLLNQIFERHEPLEATQVSTLFPLNKEGKES